MANKVIHDSANWASLWVIATELTAAGAAESTLPGGSAAASINQIVKVGNKVGVILDTPTVGRDTKWWASLDLAAAVRVTGVSGTATDGAPVYLTPGNAVTLTASTNTLIGFARQAKLATGDDLYVQLVPTLRA